MEHALPNFSVLEQPSTFQSIPALAERLGVKPDEGDMGIVIHVHPQNLRYSLTALITAFLDKLDAAAPR